MDHHNLDSRPAYRHRAGIAPRCRFVLADLASIRGSRSASAPFPPSSTRRAMGAMMLPAELSSSIESSWSQIGSRRSKGAKPR